MLLIELLIGMPLPPNPRIWAGPPGTQRPLHSPSTAVAMLSHNCPFLPLWELLGLLLETSQEFDIGQDKEVDLREESDTGLGQGSEFRKKSDFGIEHGSKLQARMTLG